MNTLPRHACKPAHAILGEDLCPGLEFRLRKIEVIDRAQPQQTMSWKSLSNTIHEGAAGVAEEIRHHGAAGDGGVLSKSLEVGLATEVLEISIIDDERGGEHGSGEFAAVSAVADEGVD